MARFSTQSGAGGNPDLNLIKTKRWGYPTQNAVAIVPATTGEALTLKSSGGAQLRWHIRDTGRSVVDYQVNILSIRSNECDGSYVVFNIDPQDIPLPTGYEYSINLNTGDSAFNGTYVVVNSTTTSIGITYPQDMSQISQDGVTGILGLPSVYTQVQVDSDGVWIKNDNWTQEPYDNHWWQFDRNGVFSGPAMGGVIMPAVRGVDGNDFYVTGSQGLYLVSNNSDIVLQPDGNAYVGSTDPNNRIARISDVTTGTTTGDIFYSTNNGAGTNYKVGDDAWIGDINSANHMSVRGVEDVAQGYIDFGNENSGIIGSDGNNLTLTSGNSIILKPTSIPGASTGSATDLKGMIAFDANYMYYCTQDFASANGGNIWSRIALDNSTW